MCMFDVCVYVRVVCACSCVYMCCMWVLCDVHDHLCVVCIYIHVHVCVCVYTCIVCVVKCLEEPDINGTCFSLTLQLFFVCFILFCFSNKVGLP